MNAQIIAECIKEVTKLFNPNIDTEHHGISHALEVMRHAAGALENSNFKNDDCIELCVLLAALLHDVDDRKIFTTSKSKQNASDILDKILLSKYPTIYNYQTKNVKKTILEMIELVSCSSNGNNMKGITPTNEWKLYPRWADRLEALGFIGIERCLGYSIDKKRPIDVKNTPHPSTRNTLHQTITSERFDKYMKNKESDSFLDHFYDKLLHLKNGFQTNNRYFLDEVTKRHEDMENFILLFNKIRIYESKKVIDNS